MTMTENELDRRLLEKLARNLIEDMEAKERDLLIYTVSERNEAITAYATLRLAQAMERIAAIAKDGIAGL
jgi:hypothetical protein